VAYKKGGAKATHAFSATEWTASPVGAPRTATPARGAARFTTAL